MDITESSSRFTHFLPLWANSQDIQLTPEDKILGDHLLITLGTLFLSLLINETPAMELPPAILSKTNVLFAPMLLRVLEDIKFNTLVIETTGTQEILDNLHQAINTQFELAVQ
jgi:hypothetical protein